MAELSSRNARGRIALPVESTPAAANAETGVFEVQITNSELGGVYRLQACTDLSVGLWIDVTTFTQTQAVTTVVVPGGVGTPQCYYRAVTP